MNKYTVDTNYELIDTGAFVFNKCDITHPCIDTDNPYKPVYTGILEKQEITVGDETGYMTAYIPESYRPAGCVFFILSDETDGKEFLQKSGIIETADKTGTMLLILDRPLSGWAPEKIQRDINMLDEAYNIANLRHKYGFSESAVSYIGIGGGAYPVLSYCLIKPERVASCALYGNINIHPELSVQLRQLYSEAIKCFSGNQPLSLFWIGYNDSDKDMVDYLKTFYINEPFFDKKGCEWYFIDLKTHQDWIGYEPVSFLCLKSQESNVDIGTFINDIVPKLTINKRWFGEFMGRVVPSRTAQDMRLKKYETVFNSKKRYWYVYEPSSYKKGEDKKYPVVMAIPGYSCTAEMLAQLSQWHVVGERRDFFVIYPNAYPGCTPSNCAPLPMWVSGSMAKSEYEDDAFFLKSILDNMHKIYPLDKNRIYVSGHSNGSKMTQDLIREAPGVFAAASPIGFTYGELNTEVIKDMPDECIPIWYIKGEYDLGIACDMNPESANYKMLELMCKTNKAVFEPVYYNNGKYESQIYYNKEKIPVVKFTKIVDMPHAQTPELSLLIWDQFFSRIYKKNEGSIGYIW